MGSPPPTASSKSHSQSPQIWWSNAIFFVYVHLAAVAGVYYFPPSAVSRSNLVLMFVLWQCAVFGITVGYHRLYSHRAFRASLGVRIMLAVMGSSGFQGSIKWWCLRHRLHHRFTDDPVHDPYAATRGLLFSHMGWIFFKPTYEKMGLVDREDLDNDPVVRFQHKYYVPLALFVGFFVPTIIGLLWGEPLQAFIWGGLVTKLLIWHCTFLVNSLAHWDGLQPYSDEDTSRGNLILAILTAGEGSHNFHHTFPHDFRSGPSPLTWDPSKWLIYTLHYFGFISGLRRAREKDVNEARSYMTYKETYGVAPDDSDDEDFGFSSMDDSGTQSDGDYSESGSGSGSSSRSSSGSSNSTMRSRSSQGRGKWQVWTMKDVGEYVNDKPGRCVVLIGEWVVDATSYLGEHPGGGALLRKYAFKKAMSESDLKPDELEWPDSTWAFEGGLNNHSRAAVRRMKELRLGRFYNKTSISDED